MVRRASRVPEDFDASDLEDEEPDVRRSSPADDSDVPQSDTNQEQDQQRSSPVPSDFDPSDIGEPQGKLSSDDNGSRSSSGTDRQQNQQQDNLVIDEPAKEESNVELQGVDRPEPQQGPVPEEAKDQPPAVRVQRGPADIGKTGVARTLDRQEKRAEAAEQRLALREKNIREAPENAEFTDPETGEQLTREEALNRVQEQREDVQQTRSQIQERQEQAEFIREEREETLRDQRTRGTQAGVQEPEEERIKSTPELLAEFSGALQEQTRSIVMEDEDPGDAVRGTVEEREALSQRITEVLPEVSEGTAQAAGESIVSTVTGSTLKTALPVNKVLPTEPAEDFTADVVQDLPEAVGPQAVGVTALGADTIAFSTAAVEDTRETAARTRQGLRQQAEAAVEDPARFTADVAAGVAVTTPFAHTVSARPRVARRAALREDLTSGRRLDPETRQALREEFTQQELQQLPQTLQAQEQFPTFDPSGPLATRAGQLRDFVTGDLGDLIRIRDQNTGGEIRIPRRRRDAVREAIEDRQPILRRQDGARRQRGELQLEEPARRVRERLDTNPTRRVRQVEERVSRVGNRINPQARLAAAARLDTREAVDQDTRQLTDLETVADADITLLEDAAVDTETQLQQDTRLTLEQETTIDRLTVPRAPGRGGFGRGSGRREETISDEPVPAEQDLPTGFDRGFRPSVEAVEFGVTAEEEEIPDDQLTGLELRPVPEDLLDSL